MPPSNAQNATGWKIALGLIMLLQGVLTTVAFRTFDAVSKLNESKVENSVMVNNVILPTLARHETAIERLKVSSGVSSSGVSSP